MEKLDATPHDRGAAPWRVTAVVVVAVERQGQPPGTAMCVAFVFVK